MNIGALIQEQTEKAQDEYRSTSSRTDRGRFFSRNEKKYSKHHAIKSQSWSWNLPTAVGEHAGVDGQGDFSWIRDSAVKHRIRFEVLYIACNQHDVKSKLRVIRIQ